MTNLGQVLISGARDVLLAFTSLILLMHRVQSCSISALETVGTLLRGWLHQRRPSLVFLKLDLLLLKSINNSLDFPVFEVIVGVDFLKLSLAGLPDVEHHV